MNHLSKSSEIPECNLVNTDPHLNISCYVHLLLHRRNEASMLRAVELCMEANIVGPVRSHTRQDVICVMENMSMGAFRQILTTEEVLRTMVHHITTIRQTPGIDNSPPRTHPTSPSITSTSFERPVRRSYRAVLSADYKDARGSAR
jgi:hypothetical protein